MISKRNNLIDLRSDTVTKPSPAMLEAIMSASVGDDVYQEDPTINELEELAAKMFGKERALFCPSGTMTNQIAIRLLTRPQDEILIAKNAHAYLYEAGGIASNSLVSVKLIECERGLLNRNLLLDNIAPDDVHSPNPSLVSIENTMNKGGGAIYPAHLVKEIQEFCTEQELSFHLDGARIFNALVETGDNPNDYGSHFDTISVCLSKGLGAPVGSLLLCDDTNIKQARKIRKSFGGGMRQAGYLAAAGIYALNNNIARLKDDHQRAKIIGEEIKDQWFVENLFPVETNIVLFTLRDIATQNFVDFMKEKGILVAPFSKTDIRMLTHLDFDDAMLDQTIDAIRQFSKKSVTN